MPYGCDGVLTAHSTRAQSHYIKIKYRKTRHDCVWVPEDELDTGGGRAGGCTLHSLGAAAELIQFALSMSVIRWIKGRGDIVVDRIGQAVVCIVTL